MVHLSPYATPMATSPPASNVGGSQGPRGKTTDGAMRKQAQAGLHHHKADALTRPRAAKSSTHPTSPTSGPWPSERGERALTPQVTHHPFPPSPHPHAILQFLPILDRPLFLLTLDQPWRTLRVLRGSGFSATCGEGVELLVSVKKSRSIPCTLRIPTLLLLPFAG